jgi:hypothetical protein
VTVHVDPASGREFDRPGRCSLTQNRSDENPFPEQELVVDMLVPGEVIGERP